MRRLVRSVGVILLLGLVAAAIVGAQAAWSPSGWFTLMALSLGAVSLLPAERRPRRILLALSLGLLLVLVGVRGVGTGSGLVTMRTLPAGEGARWLGRLLDEQDVALAGARVVTPRLPLVPGEREGLLHAMSLAYADLRRDDAYFPSPILNTLLGRQGPGAFDTLVIEPRAEGKPGVPLKFGVIFLHGYAGSFTLECWMLARAAREIGALTLCPSTDRKGRWTGAHDETILRATLDQLHARGIHRVFLAGLSNGAAGAVALAAKFTSSLEGLILLSGAPGSGGTAGLPTLVIHGDRDPLSPAATARAFAQRNHATYAEFDGGHFVWLLRRPDIHTALVDWLMRRAGYRRP